MPPSERPKTDRKRKAAAPSVGLDSVNDSPRVSESDIALKAFAYYCERGYRDGSDIEDWLRAERELRGTPPKPATRRRRQPSA
jgi:hypothetical protein